MKNPAFVGAAAGTVLGVLMLKAGGVEIVPAGGMRSGVGITLMICMLTGAGVVSAMARGLRGSRSGFWHSTVGRYLIGRMAGTAVVLGLAAALWQPSAYAVMYLALGVLAVGGVKALAAVWWLLPWATPALALIAAWFLRTPVKIIIGKGSRPFRRFYRSLRMGQGGSSGFAGICEEWANRWRPGLIFLGRSLHDRKWPVGVDDDRMMVVLAGAGGGKDETSVNPNLLSYAGGSAFVIDVKRQTAAVTAEARRRMGQDLYVLDPFGPDTARLNPLDGCDWKATDYVEQIMAIVDDLVIAGEGKDRVWAEWSKIVIAGLIDYELRRKDGEFAPPEQVDEETENE